MIPRRSSLQSHITFRNSQGESARGTLLKLERTTVVFEVYNPYSIVQLSEVLSNLTIRRGESPIYNGRAVVSNLVNTGLMLILSATFLDPWLAESASLGGKQRSSGNRRKISCKIGRRPVGSATITACRC